MFYMLKVLHGRSHTGSYDEFCLQGYKPSSPLKATEEHFASIFSVEE
jgi:hypothetical protein